MQQATAAFDNGITTATHLYNAMSPLQHRQPGMVGAMFNHPTVMCSIIPDGHHVDYAAIAIAKKANGRTIVCYYRCRYRNQLPVLISISWKGINM